MLKTRPWLLFTDGDPNTPGSGGGSEGNQERTFTQEQVNSIATREKDQGRRAAANEFTEKVKELFGDVSLDDVAAQFQAAREAEDAAKTEIEKERDRAIAERDAALTQAQTAATQAHEARVEAALTAAGATDPQIARLLDVEPGADNEALTAAVDAVKQKFPTLFGVTPPPHTDPGNPSGGSKGETDPWEAGKARAKARFKVG